MKRVGIVSYNMYGNFTNYGSALQTYALHKAINSIDPDNYESIVIDYCPDVLADKDILNPMRNMWDQNPDALERCRKTLPQIHKNYEKFKAFYNSQYTLNSQKYTSSNFNESLLKEGLDGYVCGSDTIFAVPEFGFDDGFYANYPVMQRRSVAYAASFGDYDVPAEDLPELERRLSNFNAIALRENDKFSIVKSLTSNPLYKVIDPTLLLSSEAYNDLAMEPSYDFPYLLLYSRRGNVAMQDFAEKIAKENNWKIVEISLNAENADKHIMRYDAGVEEFLGLVKKAQMVVTNSFHGMIFAIQFNKPFYVFSRKLCDTKISELLEALHLSERLVINTEFSHTYYVDYIMVNNILKEYRKESIGVLRKELDLI